MGYKTVGTLYASLVIDTNVHIFVIVTCEYCPSCIIYKRYLFAVKDFPTYFEMRTETLQQKLFIQTLQTTH